MRTKRTYLTLCILMLTLVLVGCNVIPGTGGGGSEDTSTVKPQYGTLTGIVTDSISGKKLWFGTVTMNGVTTKIKSGTFQISDLPVGTHTLEASKTFYRNKHMQVTIKPGQNVVEIPMNTIYSPTELDLFARLINAEARGEIYRGQVAVAASILNRVVHHNYPNTLTGVIKQRVGGVIQYSPVADGSINRPARPNAKQAAWEALAGWDPSLGATGFFAPAKVRPGNWVWQQIRIIDIGNHRFFRARID